MDSWPGALDWWEDADDASRLVHADALTAAGEPLGEFILLQCTRPGDPRVAELWQRHHLAWLAAAGLPTLSWFVKAPGLASAMRRAGSSFEVWSAHFHRGLLTRLWAPRLDGELKERLLARAAVRHLEMEACERVEIIDGFKLEVLGLGGAAALTERQLQVLVDSEVFAGLAEFSFNTGTERADERAAFITHAAQRAPRLTRLRLEGTLTAKVLRGLRALPWTRRLTHLDVSVNDASEELAAVLAHLPALESLSLGVHRAEPELAHALLAHPTLQQARICTSAPTPLPSDLAAQLQHKLGPQALVRF